MRASAAHVCQSCGRPIESGAERGTDSSGRPIEPYCIDCYVAGHFRDPDATEREMVERVAVRYERELGLPAGEARVRAERLVPNLRRWAGFGLALGRQWWTLLIRGLCAIGFGILMIIWPGPSVLALLMIFGAYVFIDGMFALGAALHGGRHAGLVAFEGIFGIAVGVMTFWRPGATLIALYGFFAAWAIITGILEIAAAFSLRREIPGEMWLILGGLLSIAFGVALIALPAAGIRTLVWLIGLYGIIFGLIVVALSLRVRRLAHLPQRERRAGEPTPQPA